MQTFFGKKATNYLNERYQVAIKINKIGLTYTGKIDLKGIFIKDHHQDTLLYAGQIQTSILNIKEISKGEPELGAVYIDDFTLNMKTYKDERSDNLMTFIRKFNSKKKKKTPSKPFALTATQLDLHRGRYKYINQNLSNPDILLFKNIEIDAENIKLENGDFYIKTNKLSFDDSRDLSVSNLKTQFTITSKQMLFETLELSTSDSKIEGDIAFYFTPEDFVDFENKVQIEAQFDKAIVSTNDLKPFYRGFGNDQELQLKNTSLKGTLNDFKLKNVHITGLDRSVIEGDIIIKNVIKDAKLFELEGDFTNLTTNYYDLVNLMPSVLGTSLPKQLYQLGNVKFKGNTVVTYNTVDVDVDINSRLGHASAFVLLGNLDDGLNGSYNGNLIVHDFNLGALTGKEILGKTTFNLDVDGKGFTLNTLDTKLEGFIEKLAFNQYDYSNIKVLGNLKDELFDGNLICNDPNLKFVFNGVADLAEEVDKYDFTANVDYANLNLLNIVTRDSISQFEGDVIMNVKGSNVNDAFGTISFSKTRYKNQNDNYYFEDFDIRSSFSEEGIRTIKINSPDIIEGAIKGVFKFENVYHLFRNSIGSLYTNFEATKRTTNEFMDFDFNIYNKIVEVFFPEIEFAPNTFIKGKVESDESEFKLTFKSPQIKAFENLFQKIDIQINNKNPLFNTYVAVDSINSNIYDVSDFSLINVTLRDTLFMHSEFKGGKNNRDKYDLSIYHTINEENKSVLGIRKSDLTFKDFTWHANEKNNPHDNKVIFENEFQDITIKPIILSHEGEEIKLEGILKGKDFKDIKGTFKDVNLYKITPEVENLELNGIIEGELSVLQDKGIYFPSATMMVHELKVNKEQLGEFKINIAGNETLTQYKINTKLEGQGIKKLSAIGYIDVTDGKKNIDLDVNLDRFNINGFSPLGGIVLEDLRGYVSGNAKVTGNYNNPSIDGLLTLNKSGLKIPYLNTDYSLAEESKVRLKQQRFIFENISLTDTKHNSNGTLRGYIAHQNFSKWDLGLTINAENFLILDTEEDEDALYYGTGFITGEATIKGPTDELVIDVTAETEKGTVFKIPLNDDDGLGDNSFIHFLSPEEKEARLAGKEIILDDIKGLELNFELDVDDDAEVEIVIDKETGSSLRGRGAGTLLMEINTNGKFNMWGDFIAYEGTYNFRYGAFLEKVFNVRSGGSINWDGSPTRAVLDLQAVYKTDANPAVLLETPPINRKIPVEVVVDLKGELIQPDLNFGIEFPNLSSVVKSEIEYQLDDRATRELQALSLVTQGQFYSDLTVGQNAITGNLVERASSLVNGIFSGKDDKFQIGLNYVQGDRVQDQETADRFGVTVSTQINNRILINGRVGVPVGGVSESVVVGNVEVEYLFNEDGSLRGKVFNRENDIQYIGENEGYTQGAGLSYSVDFDNFDELVDKVFTSKKKRERRRIKDSIALVKAKKIKDSLAQVKSKDSLAIKKVVKQKDTTKISKPSFLNFTNKKN